MGFLGNQVIIIHMLAQKNIKLQWETNLSPKLPISDAI